MRKQRLSNYSSVSRIWVSLLKQATGVRASVLQNYAKCVFDQSLGLRPRSIQEVVTKFDA